MIGSGEVAELGSNRTSVVVATVRIAYAHPMSIDRKIFRALDEASLITPNASKRLMSSGSAAPVTSFRANSFPKRPEAPSRLTPVSLASDHPMV